MISTTVRRAAALCLVGCLVGPTLRAQSMSDESNPFSRKQQIQTQNQNQYQQSLQNLKLAVMDGPIDPSEYVVGPGDVYSVNIWVMPSLNLQLPVTPEGSIIIPTVGEVAVAGMHLDEAKKKVVSEIRKKYIGGDVSFTLLVPRFFAVTVKGVVKNEGTVYLQATERVDVAIALANTPINPAVKGQTLTELKDVPMNQLIVKPDTVGSLRKITIRHRDGTSSTADLEKYFIQKESRLNPLLRDGDVIIVPGKKLETDFVGVYGAVNGEGPYEYVDGDSLMAMLRIAKGLSPQADSGHIEVFRSDESGDSVKALSADLRSSVTKRSADIPLQRGDRIVVGEISELRRDNKIYIEGEILHPGYYPITRDSSTLTDVVRLAGGFKDEALLSASQVYRKVKSSRTPTIDRLENNRGSSAQEDSIYYIIENSIRMNGELVVADFVGLFERNDKSKEVYLRNGDHIIIASKTRTVYVFGQVVQPGHVPFLKDQNYKYYIVKAGGFSDDAIKGEVKIIKANTKQWLSPDETQLEEGDYIWVPKEPYRPFSYYVQIYSQLFSIVGTLATLAILVIQTRK